MISEERLGAAARAAQARIAAGYPEPEDCRHAFSPEFEADMAALFRPRQTRRAAALVVARRAACLVLVLLLGCGTWLSVDAQARERLLGWVHQQTADTQLYFYTGERREKPDPARYRLGQVPEGYAARSVYLAEFGASHCFRNEAGAVLTFGYLKRDSAAVSSNISFSTEGMEGQTVTVSGGTADFYYGGQKGNILVWTREDTLFYLDGPLTREELTRLAEAVRRVP